VGDTINGTFPGADSDEKRCTPGPAQEILGWDADLRSATVNPNIKGREKLLLYFFTFNTNRPHSIKEWERLASLAERYSTGVCGMRGMVAPLHNAVAECHARAARSSCAHRSAWCNVRAEQRGCIEMWRVVASMMLLDPTSLSVPMAWVARNEPAFPPELRSGSRWKLVTDASPWKICAVLKDVDDQVVCWSTLTLPFESAAFQNVREYLGLLLGLLMIHTAARKGLVTLGDNPNIMWEGDNTSALAWAESGKVKSLGGQMANVAVTWAQLYGRFNVDATVHLAGVNMGDVDGATRDKVLTSLTLDTFVAVEQETGVLGLFALCNPVKPASPVSFHTAFTKVHAHLREILR
jgi:hypothetical protein